MKSIALFSLIILTNIPLWAQNIEELDRRNGFKTIKLGSSIDSVKEAVLKKDIIELKQFPAKLYETKHVDYKSIGEVAVKKIELKTYKGLIYEIDVFLAKDPRVMQGLEKSYGVATYSVRLHAYYWRAQNLSLVFKGDAKQIHLSYKSAPLIRMMHEDKNKKIEEVADEF